MSKPLINSLKVTVLLGQTLIFTTCVWCDSSAVPQTVNKQQLHHALTTPPNRASDASFDKRLPPVIPGEELSDSGKTIKVWSSAGPIPDSIHPNTNCQNNSSNCDGSQGAGNFDIIIDRRKETKPAKTSDSWAR